MKSYRGYEMKNNVRAARVAMKLSQKELAILCNTTQNTISSIETNKYGPSAYLAALLCDTLKVPFEKLFFFEYEGVRVYFDFDPHMSRTVYSLYLKDEFKSRCKLEEELEKLTTMNPLFE